MKYASLVALLGNLVIGVCFAATPDSALTAKQASVIESMGHLPSIENMAISPDGSRLALIRTKEEKRFLVLLSVADRKITSSQEVAGVKVRDIEWADNENLLLTISKYTHTRGTIGGNLAEHYVLTSINVVKNKVVNPLENMPRAESRDNSFIASKEIIGSPAIRKRAKDTLVVVPGISAGIESKDASGNMYLMPSLFKFKAGINISSLVVRGTESGAQWTIDEQGEEFSKEYFEQASQRWTLKVMVAGKWKTVVSEKYPIEQPSVVGLSPNGASLWIDYVDPETEEGMWMSVALADGKVTKNVEELSKYKRFLVSAHTPRAMGGYLRSDRSLEFFDSKLRENWAAIVSHFRGARVEFVSASQGGAKMVVQVEGVRDGYKYVLFDADTYDFVTLGSVYSGFNNINEVQPMTYEAQDKYKLNAFVTYPQGERKNLPLIVMPHGGPEWHEKGEFDWWAQALASLGYVVVQPNFRGSNTTIALRNAGFGEWGRKMQTDLSDVVRRLVGDGVADASRVCIVGASYGGYAALAGATLDVGVYRCAVSVAGISDLKEFRQFLVSKYDRYNSTGTRYFDRYLGVSDASASLLGQLSPGQNIDKVNIPVLLVHGKDDSVVPYDQSEDMYNVLKSANKQVEFVTLKHEDHWLSNSDTRMQMLQATVDFLLKHNPPNRE